MSTKVISLNEVAQHKSKNDLWLVIHNKVYDITSFVVEVSLKNNNLCLDYQY